MGKDPIMELSKVDLPAPLPPITVTMLPGGTAMFAPTRALTLPYLVDRLSTCNIGSADAFMLHPRPPQEQRKTVHQYPTRRRCRPSMPPERRDSSGFRPAYPRPVWCQSP